MEHQATRAPSGVERRERKLSALRAGAELQVGRAVEFGFAAANKTMKMRELANMGNADRERVLEADGRGVHSADLIEDCGEHRRPEAEPGTG